MANPIILSTWKFGEQAGAAGWPYLVSPTPSSLDAVEQGCRAVEADPQVMSVGYGGRPDRSGQVTLDASIMLSPARCGSVCFVRRFMHPVSIARLVMEKSPHVMLAGEGAERFAELHGMRPSDLVTDQSRAAWEKWRSEHPEDELEGQGWRQVESAAEKRGDAAGGNGLPLHQPRDTVGVLARDAAGRLAGACSTSGWPFKLPGRVGDSPIIGHGLYVDPQHGAAVATGSGELIMGVCATFLAVEWMRRGASPREAAREVVGRVVETYAPGSEHQVAILVLAASGRFSAAAIRPGYQTAVRTAAGTELVDPDHVAFP